MIETILYLLGGYVALKAFEATLRQAPQEFWWDETNHIVWHVVGGTLDPPFAGARPASEWEVSTFPVHPWDATVLAGLGN